jgi:hypothetical protein
MKKILFDIAVVALGALCVMALLDVFSIGLRIALFGTKLFMIPVAALFLVYVFVHFFFIRRNK